MCFSAKDSCVGKHCRSSLCFLSQFLMSHPCRPWGLLMLLTSLLWGRLFPPLALIVAAEVAEQWQQQTEGTFLQLWVQPAVKTPSKPGVRGLGLVGRLRVSCATRKTW